MISAGNKIAKRLGIHVAIEPRGQVERPRSGMRACAPTVMDRRANRQVSSHMLPDAPAPDSTTRARGECVAARTADTRVAVEEEAAHSYRLGSEHPDLRGIGAGAHSTPRGCQSDVIAGANRGAHPLKSWASVCWNRRTIFLGETEDKRSVIAFDISVVRRGRGPAMGGGAGGDGAEGKGVEEGARDGVGGDGAEVKGVEEGVRGGVSVSFSGNGLASWSRFAAGVRSRARDSYSTITTVTAQSRRLLKNGNARHES